LHLLTSVAGSNFEAVDESSLMTDPNSAKAGQMQTPPSSGIITNQWVSLVAKSSGKCLDVTSSRSNTKMDQRTCSGTNGQRVMLAPVNGGYEITVQRSNLQLDVAGGPSASADGTSIIQYRYSGASNQIWTVTPASTSGYFNFRAVSSGKCLDVSGLSLSDGAYIVQWSCTGADNQAWQFKP
jgi:hypothetical protein